MSSSENGSKSVGETFTVGGVTYTVGAKLGFGRRSVTVVGVSALEGSVKAGIPHGEYLVVSEEVSNGQTRYRALVGNELYSIRKYNTPDAVIAKHRESGGPRRGGEAESDGIELSAQAQRTLDQYLALARQNNADDVVSRLVVEHLGPEVERLRKADQAIKQLPVDFLTTMAALTEEQRAQLIASLKR